jgi:cyclase
MSKNIRIIPRMDIKGPNVVKGIHLEGLRVVGRPELFAPKYYQDGADELLYIDCVASLYGRNSLDEIIRRAAEKIFIPLTVGGGVRTVNDVRRLLRAGADKVAINTAAIKNPQLIEESVKAFGSQCIVISIQARRAKNEKYECLTDYGREKTGIDVMDWAKKVTDLGAGEILLTSIDKEGAGEGYDIELSRRVSEMLSIPVIACGGAGNANHVISIIRQGKVDAVSAASIFHYALLEYMGNAEHIEEGNIDFIRAKNRESREVRKGIECVSIKELKEIISKAGVSCRREIPMNS